MRITEIDLQCEDIMWFAVDNQNHIFVCTSGGCGNVPEFVCRSRENVDYLLGYFFTVLKDFTQEKILTEYTEMNSLIKDYITLSRKGIYCFDVCMDERKYDQYVKLCEPVKPLTYDELPREIKNILSGSRVDIDVAKEKMISVEHAYE